MDTIVFQIHVDETHTKFLVQHITTGFYVNKDGQLIPDADLATMKSRDITLAIEQYYSRRSPNMDSLKEEEYYALFTNCSYSNGDKHSWGSRG